MTRRGDGVQPFSVRLSCGLRWHPIRQVSDQPQGLPWCMGKSQSSVRARGAEGVRRTVSHCQ